MKKRALLIPGVIVLAGGLCFGQDLAAAAKKEKERRDAQKGHKIVVINNASLTELKKKPSVPSVNPEGGPDLDAAGNAGAANPAAQKPAATPAPPPGPEPESPGTATREQQKAELQDRYDRAKERLDLLGLKMLSLRQQLTTFDSMQTKDKVQKEFAETYQKFQQAQADAAKAKEDLDKVLGGGGAKTPSAPIK
jgi:hypothetical protein